MTCHSFFGLVQVVYSIAEGLDANRIQKWGTDAEKCKDVKAKPRNEISYEMAS